MSFGGSGSNTHTEEARVLSLHVNQSAYGVAKARVWGKQRVTANMLWYGDWKAIPHTETTTTSSGGKGGGGSSSSSNTTYTYTAGLVLALCAGPIAGVGKVWEEKNLTDLATLGYTLKTGELRQAPWSHLVANYPDQAVSYSGIAYVANNALDLGTSSSQPSVSFEVFGERLIPDGDDAHPADVIYDIVSDPLEGVGLPSSLIANAADYALWCDAKGLVVSLAATTQSASRDWIAQVLKATLAEAIWSNGQIKLIPYGDEPVGAWSPVTAPDYDLTEADLLEAPRHRRKQPADATNRVTLNYTSRAKDYNTSTITRDDLSAVTQYGVRPETLDLPCITGEAQAAVVCEFWRDRNLYIRNEWEIDVDERFCLIESMDLLTLTFAPQGLYRQPVRVVEVSDDGSGTITLLVEEWPFGLLSATIVPTQSISGYVPEYNVAPGATHTPVIFEAPNALTVPNLEIWIGASGGQHWGGARVWVSDDNSSYQQIGVISSPSRHGVLTSLLAAGSDPDLTHSLYLDMSASHGQLLSGTRADADNGNTISWVDGEIISYETAELVDSDKYALSYLRRGQKGTVSAGHLTGSQFVRLDDAVFKYRIPRERIGSPVWIKLQSFNKYGRSPEPLDTVDAHLYTIAGNKPLPLTSLTATGGLFEIGLAWTTTPGQVGIDYIEIWSSATNNRASAHNLTSQKHPVAKWNHSGLQPGEPQYYWARIMDSSWNASDFYPSSATGGIGASAISDPTALLDMLQGALGMPHLAAELAEPIGLISTIATDIIQTALDLDVVSDRVLLERAVTDATTYLDPVTGKYKLLATVAITTDVEARLTQVKSEADATAAAMATTVATLSTVSDDLSSAQSQITQLAHTVSLGVSDVQIADIVGQASGAITVESAAAAQALAEVALRQSLGLDAATDADLLSRSNVALAQLDIKANSDALGAEASARLALAAVVASGDQTNAAAIQSESNARATADSALSQTITTLQATVTSGDSANAAAIRDEATTSANADAALAERLNTVQASLGDSVASVQTYASATAGKVASIEAKWGAKVQVMEDGNLASAGMEILAGGGTTAIGYLADKFLFYRPDGKGAPKQLMTMGVVNGVAALGFDGSAMFDGSVTARQINGTGLKITGAVNVGAYTDYAWPDAGLGGAHLSAQGLLLGNWRNAGKFFQITSGINNGGNAVVITNIPAFIDTLNIKGNAVTVPTGGEAYGSFPTVTVQLDSRGYVHVSGGGNAISSGGSGGSLFVAVQHVNSGLVKAEMGISVQGGYSGAISTAAMFGPLEAGTHYFTLTGALPIGCSWGWCFITALGAKT